MDGASTLTDDDLTAARAGDDAAFERLVAPLRRELHAHCYRMLGSTHDADDALQDALLRAWRGIARFEGRSTVRSWLYTVATRTCLDLVEARRRRALPMDLGPSSSEPVLDDAPAGEMAWLTPYPDTALAVEQRESVELAFVAALQHLPGNQRAALLLFEVLSYSAAEIAAMMETSTASVNSALQRARRIVAERVPPVSQQRTLADLDDARLRAVVDGYARALERRDAEGLVSLLTDDVTWSMPPLPSWYSGREAVMAFARAVPLGDCGEWRTVTTRANGQPAVALYLDGPATHRDHDDGGRFRAWSLTVLTLRDGAISELTSFIGPEVFRAHGLPSALAE
ncbi:sigma-70 family RNA polymerase sigma factor [Actinomycetospora endophytica]|uniref:Sigma-70 family RNA polymerase sigma factor n=1 Tax=Actinomycetospora endophytica TaxID=2291215 RepID=A0ABS8P4B6_9PSEU|nr:sigma-70 family RNA polymerase sigma factor [Actinomycetospora endophytica]MCD2193083.1 sigma-70 family RNA polymerase sigma factor [Actinomycetospora endophytica]